ncbi:MAG: 30S ribosomal protein S14 [Candidatus Muproteobacteria bacterium RIFCSPHIGHO2_01_FULL_65_16]|uniref:Small ribosomal subunit protein uS14 n=3 Tax=Candidatus Muproteobacteria TaxID=1817795 RepID=A0A1F6TF77_9PROT|nr:MAG: 30S ribosomal protein S14 [Candidatus Muproteobacteria bacterium RBG_16_65_31]OGI46434.1 MAG: 30S ribosomal protein S14 [Candidatus Muproteobacteria bacterium RIFCSPHIGHO2_01_FULL_65_16]OGI48792.1 MAG: 30S ribosomal protein S14 [Candidatus Muproteobacteria bacterium RIFCSPHIGHO2_02_FULL_65_16]
MARKSILERDKRRRALVVKHAVKRAELREMVKNTKLSEETRHDAMLQLQKLPRDSNPTRMHNRCRLTGRSRGVYRKFGLARSKLREVMMRGEAPGVVKASW